MGNKSSKKNKAPTKEVQTKNDAPETKQEKESKMETKTESPPASPKAFQQAGGHVGAFKKLDGGKIMKRVGKNEFQFYSKTLSQYPTVSEYLPKFFGTETIEQNEYITIEDLTSVYNTPCILDIKIGISSVGEDASPEKKESMGKKDSQTTTVKLGLRITAMKVYQVDKSDYVSFGKDWGKKVTEDNFFDSLMNFFHNGKGVRVDLLPKYLEFLRNLLEFFESQRDLRFYSSSLLFLYDADESNKKAVPQVRMIDFAHVHEITDGGRDEGYIIGLKNLIAFFEKINP